jgi:hypothetical protein
MEEFDVILEILSDFLGDPKKVYEHSSQISFNCQTVMVMRIKVT